MSATSEPVAGVGNMIDGSLSRRGLGSSWQRGQRTGARRLQREKRKAQAGPPASACTLPVLHPPSVAQPSPGWDIACGLVRWIPGGFHQIQTTKFENRKKLEYRRSETQLHQEKQFLVQVRLQMAR